MLQIFVREADRIVLSENNSLVHVEAALPALWYDLVRPSSAERRQVEEALGISIPTRDAQKSRYRRRSRRYDDKVLAARPRSTARWSR